MPRCTDGFLCFHRLRASLIVFSREFMGNFLGYGLSIGPTLDSKEAASKCLLFSGTWARTIPCSPAAPNSSKQATTSFNHSDFLNKK